MEILNQDGLVGKEYFSLAKNMNHLKNQLNKWAKFA